MVGQINNKELVEKLVSSDNFPRFIIITGDKGSGRKTFAKYIANQLAAMMVTASNSVDDVRNIIEVSYKCSGNVVYLFSDADKMSAQAKNALLKVTEEPPKRAFFIMTLEDIENTIQTLKSRCVVITMEPYTVEDLRKFTSNENILYVAETPGQVYEMEQMNMEEYIEFCTAVLDSIAHVTGVNAMKIGQRLKYKEDGKGYDPVMFLQTIANLCIHRMAKVKRDNDIPYYRALAYTVFITLKYRRDLKIVGVKKDSTIDLWILDIREIMRGEMYDNI